MCIVVFHSFSLLNSPLLYEYSMVYLFECGWLFGLILIFAVMNGAIVDIPLSRTGLLEHMHIHF